MAGKLSPAAQVEMAKLEGFTQEVGRINALVEQFAAAKTGQDNLKASLKRAAGHSKLKFMTSGFAQLSQLCSAIELAASRSGAQPMLARSFREHMGALKFQLDFEMRTVLRNDADLQASKKKIEQAKGQAAE